MNEGSMMIRMLMGMFYPNSISSWGEDINLVIFVGYLPPQPTEYYSACLQHAPVYYSLHMDDNPDRLKDAHLYASPRKWFICV